MVRVALVTGASRGIGAATAVVLAERGYRVIVNYRTSAPQADEVVATIAAAGGEAVAMKALRTIAEQPQLAIDYIALFLNRLTREEVQRYYERYIAPCYTSDGRVDLNVARHAVDAVASELGVPAAASEQMYQPAL